MGKGLFESTVIDQEHRALRQFLLLFYSIGFSFDLFYYFLYPTFANTARTPGLVEGGLGYGLYIIQLLLLPIAIYLIQKNRPYKVKYIYLIVYTLVTMLNDLFIYVGGEEDYSASGGSVVEVVLILFAPVFLNRKFFWLVSGSLIFKSVVLFLAIRQPVLIMPLVLYPILSCLSLIVLNRFIGYVNAIRNSYYFKIESIVKGIITTLELKDPYTRGHSERVAHMSLLLAKKMGKFTEDELKSYYYACLLHDVGKVSIPDSILMKPSRLTDEEFEIIKAHPNVGAQAIRGIEGLEGSEEVVLHHHERWDGNGYPQGLKGDEIPLLARVTAIADAFDAMTSKRSYRDALSVDEAYHRILEGKGSQFDPKLVDLFQSVYPSFVKYVKEEQEKTAQRDRTGNLSHALHEIG